MIKKMNAKEWLILHDAELETIISDSATTANGIRLFMTLHPVETKQIGEDRIRHYIRSQSWFVSKSNYISNMNIEVTE